MKLEFAVLLGCVLAQALQPPSPLLRTHRHVQHAVSASTVLPSGNAAWDVVVYGSTSGAVIAAVAAARRGSRTLLLNSAPRIGGCSSGGLGMVDKGQPIAIGGYANEFFLRVAQHYNASATEPLYLLEPHVAESVFWDMLNSSGVQVVPSGPISSVHTSGGVITSVCDTSPACVSARVFIDGTYEGDLMAAAGVTFTYGREGSAAYSESFAGRRQPFSLMDFEPVSPYNAVRTGSERADNLHMSSFCHHIAWCEYGFADAYALEVVARRLMDAVCCK